MQKITTGSNNNIYTKPINQTQPQTVTKNNSKETLKKASLGIGFTALAASGIYLASKGQNIEKLFKTSWIFLTHLLGNDNDNKPEV